MRSPTMARSVAASNNRPNYIYTSSLALYPAANNAVCVAGVRRENVRDHEEETESKRREKEKGRKRKKCGGRKDAENKEKEKIEKKRWVVQPIRGLSIYDERKNQSSI